MNTNVTEEINEEFNNFMYRVTEVEKIVKKLSSNDKNLQEIGTLEADQYLREKNKIILNNLDEENLILKVKDNRTLINKKALLKNEKNQETMSQEAFMEEVGKDADRRYKDLLVRREKMETQKKQAGLAFKRGDYERALNCYNKAIEQIRDNVMLYNNRCLTYIKLKMYKDAMKDAEQALRLEEDNFKAQLLLCKAFYLNGNRREFEKTLKETKETHLSQVDFINEFVDKLKVETTGDEE